MSAAIAAAGAAAALNQRRYNSESSRSYSENPASENLYGPIMFVTPMTQPRGPSRYESLKRRDWAEFGQYLRSHQPGLALDRCSGAHVVEYLNYLDRFGDTKVHSVTCPCFGQGNNPAPAACPCPLQQASGSLDALVGRLRAAFDEYAGGCHETANPFMTPVVRIYLREVRDSQAMARGIVGNYEKKNRGKLAAA